MKMWGGVTLKFSCFILKFAFTFVQKIRGKSIKKFLFKNK